MVGVHGKSSKNKQQERENRQNKKIVNGELN
jgi:hypothetical protein